MDVSAIKKKLSNMDNKRLKSLNDDDLKTLLSVCLEISEEKAPKMVNKGFACYGCGGSGSKVYQCSTCKGSGRAEGRHFGVSGTCLRPCKHCGGQWRCFCTVGEYDREITTSPNINGSGVVTGKCTTCQGSGKIKARVPADK